MGKIFGIKVKSYDWMKDDELALVLPGIKNITKFPDGHKEEVTVKEYQIIIIKNVAAPTHQEKRG